MIALVQPDRLWFCPRCGTQSVTHEARPHTRFHRCKASGLEAPMLPVGSRARLTSVEREDYIGTDKVTLDKDGRPIMAIVTEHPDGRQDRAVYAPAASVSAAAGS